MKKITNFFINHPIGIIITVIIPTIISYILLIIKPIKIMIKFLIQNPILFILIIVLIVSIIIISVIRYFIHLNQTIKGIDQYVRTLGGNHAGWLIYIRENYQKKPDAKTPLEFDNELLGTSGEWMPPTMREALKKKINEPDTSSGEIPK